MLILEYLPMLSKFIAEPDRLHIKDLVPPEYTDPNHSSSIHGHRVAPPGRPSEGEITSTSVGTVVY